MDVKIDGVFFAYPLAGFMNHNTFMILYLIFHVTESYKKTRFGLYLRLFIFMYQEDRNCNNSKYNLSSNLY